MKKIISLILCLTLMFSLAVPAFAAYEEHPTIYITGAQTNDIYSAQNEKLYPFVEDIDAMAVIKEALVPCLEKLALGFIIGDYTEYAQEFYNAFVPIYADIALDKNGEASNGSHPAKHSSTESITQKTSGYGAWDYLFWYDWRLSPLTTADELKVYIDNVKSATGEEKVNLMGRCYGANVIATYLAKYPDHALASVDDVAYLASSAVGIDMLGALFTGNLEFDDDAIENFVNFFMEEENLIEDEGINAFILAFVELFNQIKLLGITGDALENLVQTLKTDLIPPLIRDTFGSMGAYWSMVPEEYFEEAIEFVYGGCEDEYAKHLEKLNAYYNEVQVNIEQDMLDLKEKGIDFQIVVKYNFPNYPIAKYAASQSDGNTACFRQAFGGTYANYGEVLSDKYIASMADTKYLSPDRKIDATSCLFPETTWFIKDLHHDSFPENFDRFIMDLMNNEATVTEGQYSQFFVYDAGAYESTGRYPAVEGVDEDAAKSPDNPLVSLMRFFTQLFNTIIRFIKGELSFGELFSKEG